MEEEHAVSVRPCHDSRPGVAQFDCPVVDRRHQARRQGLLHSQTHPGNSYVGILLEVGVCFNSIVLYFTS